MCFGLHVPSFTIVPWLRIDQNVIFHSLLNCFEVSGLRHISLTAPTIVCTSNNSSHLKILGLKHMHALRNYWISLICSSNWQRIYYYYSIVLKMTTARMQIPKITNCVIFQLTLNVSLSLSFLLNLKPVVCTTLCH